MLMAVKTSENLPLNRFPVVDIEACVALRHWASDENRISVDFVCNGISSMLIFHPFSE